jgi:hypothetical protein
MSKLTQGNNPKKRLLSRWEFFGEVFVEPVFLTLAIVMFYGHFKGVWDKSPDSATFWAYFNTATRDNVLVWSVLTVAVILWILVVGGRINRESQRVKEFRELVRTNNENFGELKESVEKLAEEIRKDRTG